MDLWLSQSARAAGQPIAIRFQPGDQYRTIVPGLLIAAVSQRPRSPYHKRLMLLTMLPILTTPLARISGMLALPVPIPVGGMLMSDLFLAALVAYDLKTLGYGRSWTSWGGGILLVSELLRVAIGPTAAWHSFAAMLIG